MGNCVTSNKILGQDEKDEQPREERAIERSVRHVDGGKKKSVRFKLHEEEEEEEEEEDGNGEERQGCSKGGAVRIRVVVTQRELIRILNTKSKYSSVEQMLGEMKLKSRKISQIRSSDDEGTNGSWRPALESIPEDH
ncbi:ABC transporter F family member 4 [Camellia sinensis]|uniref:Uncharacterized protein n=1 Tax=Camellia sinensis var. sinensis TaxID=542762 RepID=A0A4V3WQ11_CAMSN|nr:ABC transporter F family member 4 [Camellia sinensis]THG18497.1 hypothetical protein TEA_029836 [Camellia sinensis var. sinensis]